MIENRSLTPAQVARHLQVSEVRVLRWLSEGQLRGVKVGPQWRTSMGFLMAFLERHANQPPTEFEDTPDTVPSSDMRAADG